MSRLERRVGSDGQHLTPRELPDREVRTQEKLEEGENFFSFLWFLLSSLVQALCGKGAIRDTLGHVPSVLLGHEIYVRASVLGACTYVGLNGFGVGRLPAMVGGFMVTFVVRGLAIRFGWSLPVFRGSSRRERWKSHRP